MRVARGSALWLALLCVGLGHAGMACAALPLPDTPFAQAVARPWALPSPWSAHGNTASIVHAAALVGSPAVGCTSADRTAVGAVLLATTTNNNNNFEVWLRLGAAASDWQQLELALPTPDPAVAAAAQVAVARARDVSVTSVDLVVLVPIEATQTAVVYCQAAVAGTGGNSACDTHTIASAVADSDWSAQETADGAVELRLLLAQRTLGALQLTRILDNSSGGRWAGKTLSPRPGGRAITCSPLDVAYATDVELVVQSSRTGWPAERTWFVSLFNHSEPRYFTAVGAVIDGNVTAMTYDDQGTLWVGSDACINVLLPDGTFSRIDGRQGGLPYANVTALLPTRDMDSSGARRMFVGTTLGLLQFDYDTRQFRTYNHGRYLRGSTNITRGGVLPASTDLLLPRAARSAAAPPALTRVLAVTSVSVNEVALEAWTLADKAAALQAVVTPRHSRHNLVADCALSEFGNLSSWFAHCGDNDGEHTAEYLVSQAYRYAVTKDPAVRAAIWPHFDALAMLHNITGIDGFFARTYFHAAAGEQCVLGKGYWYNSSVMPGWVWKGDTSSDEVSGHLLALPLLYDLVAETDAERERIAALIDSTTSYIVKHNFTLASPDGYPTTWGRWNPEYVNQNVSAHDDRGRQSLEILSWLTSAYRITKKPLYLQAIHELVSEANQYSWNLLNTDTEYPYDMVYFDHVLTFLSFEVFAWSITQMDNATFAQLPAELVHHVNRSAVRSYAYLRPQRNAKIAATMGLMKLHAPRLQGRAVDPSVPFYTDFSAEDFEADVAIARKSLEEWPLDLIDWPVDNSARMDIFPLNMYDSTHTAVVLPRNEMAAYLRWTNDLYQLSGGSGLSEYEPTPFLEAYWRARFYQLL